MYTDGFSNKKNKNHRDYEASAIIGSKRQGKTTLCKLLVDKYIQKYPNKRVLVYDVAKAFGKSKGFKGYPTISLNELYNGRKIKNKTYYWSKGIRRILPDSETDHEEILKYMADNFTNGLCVIDEGTAVFTQNPNKKRKELLFTHTNNKVDIYIVFHSLRYVPKPLRGHFWNYFLFKVPDVVSDYKDLEKLGFPNPKKLYDALIKVERAPYYEDKILQYFEVIKMDFHKNNKK